MYRHHCSSKPMKSFSELVIILNVHYIDIFCCPGLQIFLELAWVVVVFRTQQYHTRNQPLVNVSHKTIRRMLATKQTSEYSTCFPKCMILPNDWFSGRNNQKLSPCNVPAAYHSPKTFLAARAPGSLWKRPSPSFFASRSLVPLSLSLHLSLRVCAHMCKCVST